MAEAAISILQAQRPDRLRVAVAAGDSADVLTRFQPAVVIHEGAHAESFAEFRSGLFASDIRFVSGLRCELKVRAVEVRADPALDLAESHTTGRLGDRDIDAHGTGTMLLVRTRDDWRIRHLHEASR